MKISHRDFIHPEDYAALESLKAIPLFSSCVKMFLNVGVEQFLHGISMAQKIRLGPDQLPHLYGHLPPICEFLKISEPEFYLEMNPQPNAYTQGDTRVFITITSGLVEHLDEDELQAVLAHECGHIACHHVLYHTMAGLLTDFGSAIFGPLAPLSAPVRLALLYWDRRGELSADRAAAAYFGSCTSMTETLIRLAGGPKSITESVDLNRYIQQAEAYDKLQESHWDKLLQGFATLNASHPFPAVRVRELHRWGQSDAFQKILEARDQSDSILRCPGCEKPFQEHWQFCSHCGASGPPISSKSPMKENEA